MNVYFRLGKGVLFKRMSNSRILVLMKIDHENTDVEDISYVEVNHAQAWVLGLMNGSITLVEISKFLSKEFGSAPKIWMDSLSSFINELVSLGLVQGYASPSPFDHELNISRLISLKPSTLSAKVKVVSRYEEILEIYAGIGEINLPST